MVSLLSRRPRPATVPAQRPSQPEVTTPTRAVALFPFHRDTVYLVFDDQSGQWGPLWFDVPDQFGSSAYGLMMLRTRLGAHPASIRADIPETGVRLTADGPSVRVTSALTPLVNLGVELTVYGVCRRDLETELVSAVGADHSPRALALYPVLLSSWPQL